MDATGTQGNKPHSAVPSTKQADVLGTLSAGGLNLPRLAVTLLESQRNPGGYVPDGVLEIRRNGRSARFVFEYKPLNTPKTLEMAVAQSLRYASGTGYLPMIIVPFLSEERLLWLEQQGVSGMDLSGNAIILAPDFDYRRSGQPNRVKTSAPLGNPYRGSSSILARCFLLQPQFETLVSLRRFATARLQTPDEPGDARLTPGTVSKVVRALEEDKIILRDERGLRLIAPHDLMRRLLQHYRRPGGPRALGKSPLSRDDAWHRLRAEASQHTLRYTATGASSASEYGLLSGPDCLAIYTSDIQHAAEQLELVPGRVFPNLELVEDRGDLVYFDTRTKDGATWASPVQTWLELMDGGPRDQAAAQSLADAIVAHKIGQLL